MKKILTTLNMEKIKQLEHKWLLLDTCFVINAIKYADCFSELLSDFSKNNCTLAISQVVKCEYLRSAKDSVDLQNLEKHLEDFDIIPVNPKIYDSINEIWPLYRRCNSINSNKQVSLADVYNSALLRQYGQKLSLLTMDYNDYPLELHKRSSYGVIDVGKQLINWSAYEWREDNYEKIVRKFKKRSK